MMAQPASCVNRVSEAHSGSGPRFKNPALVSNSEENRTETDKVQAREALRY